MGLELGRHRWPLPLCEGQSRITYAVGGVEGGRFWRKVAKPLSHPMPAQLKQNQKYSNKAAPFSPGSLRSLPSPHPRQLLLWRTCKEYTHHRGGAGREGVTSTRRAGQSPDNGETETTARVCHQDVATNVPLPHGMPSPTAVTQQESGRWQRVSLV